MTALRVLILHSRYLSGALSGENRVVEDECRLLSEAGHEVDLWSPSPDSLRGLGRVRLGASAVWSQAAINTVVERIRRQRIDVVHFHNLFPMLSPAAISAAHGEGAAVVMTLHNYRLFCLPATLRRDGFRCQECLGHLPWRGVVHACYRDSVLGSAVLASSLALHRLRGTFDAVDLFLPVSGFVLERHNAAGIANDRMLLKPNFAWPTRRRDGPGDHFLYVGRLSAEKGLSALIGYWESEGVSARLFVIGDGPEEEELRRLAPPHVEFLGALPSAEIPERIAQARALIVPSNWPDSAPRVVLEAYACGVPVLASNVGGLPELVEDERSGLVIEHGNAWQWRRAVERLSDDRESERLGEGALRVWEERFTPEKALHNLQAAYALAYGRRHSLPDSHLDRLPQR